MGLFSGKECSFCGKQSGVLSNRKLVDGNICRECRLRLSPFYYLTKGDKAADIAAQLEYRERNLAELDGFRPTVAVGGEGKVYIDMQMGKFALAREEELREENPDLFSLSGLRSCEFYVRENYVKGDENERSRYVYQFFLRVQTDHPFIRSFSYDYSGITVSSTHRIKDEEIRQVYLGQRGIKTGVSAFFSGVNRRAFESYLEQYALAQNMIAALNGAAEAFRGGSAFRQAAGPTAQPIRQQPEVPLDRQPSAANFCPSCGVRLSVGAFCPNCGKRL